MHVYIAGPYTKPDPVLNMRRAVIAADRVRDAGHVPFVPHLNLAWDLVSPASYDEWLAWDLAWLERCDVMVRLDGESPGADVEEEFCRNNGIPIYYGIDAFLKEARQPAVEVKKTLNLDYQGVPCPSCGCTRVINLVYQGVPCPRCSCTMTIEIEGEL